MALNILSLGNVFKTNPTLEINIVKQHSNVTGHDNSDNKNKISCGESKSHML